MRFKPLLQIFIVVAAMQWLSPSYAVSAPNQGTTHHQVAEIKYNSAQQNNKYQGYEVDAFSSASKLAAQRSHTPAGEDERNFAVFTGIVVIFIIVFLSQIIIKRD